MFGLGIMELGIIALILLLLFGAKRIPLVMGSIGQGIREFKQSFREDEQSGMPSGDARREDRSLR